MILLYETTCVRATLGASAEASQRHKRPVVSVQVILDHETGGQFGSLPGGILYTSAHAVAREARACEPGLLPRSISLLGGDQVLDAAPDPRGCRTLRRP